MAENKNNVAALPSVKLSLGRGRLIVGPTRSLPRRNTETDGNGPTRERDGDGPRSPSHPFATYERADGLSRVLGESEKKLAG